MNVAIVQIRLFRSELICNWRLALKFKMLFMKYHNNLLRSLYWFNEYTFSLSCKPVASAVVGSEIRLLMGFWKSNYEKVRRFPSNFLWYVGEIRTAISWGVSNNCISCCRWNNRKLYVLDRSWNFIRIFVLTLAVLTFVRIFL